MQAFSRTNRIYDATKTFGNIVTFRDLERPTIDAITLFGDKNTKNVVLEKATKSTCRALPMRQPVRLNEVLWLLFRSWSSASLTLPVSTVKNEKKAFVKLFGEYLRAENILQNYDEFATLKALQKVDINDPEAVETFKAEHYVDDEKFAELQTIRLPAERKVQDYRSAYNDIRDWQRREKQQTTGINQPQTGMMWCLKLTC